MRDDLFNELVESIQEAGEIKKGIAEALRTFKYSPMDIKNIREKLEVSQSELALILGVSKRTIQNWEQGRREPVGPAKALLKIVSYNPALAIQALQS